MAQTYDLEAISRGARMLRTALGPQITEWLDDDSVVEIMLNPDGRLWLDRLTSGLEDAGKRLSALREPRNMRDARYVILDSGGRTKVNLLRVKRR